MTYYKGYIISKKDIEGNSYERYIGKQKYLRSINDIVFDTKKLSKITIKCFEILRNIIYDCYCKNIKKVNLIDDELISNLNENYLLENKEKINLINKIDEHIGSATKVIYELVKDNNGNLFGKELYTGCLFPIYDNIDNFFKYNIVVYANKNNVNPCEYSLEIIPSIKVLNLLECVQIIVGHTVANQNEVLEYKNRFNKKRIFNSNKKQEEQFKREITFLSNQNVFKEDFAILENKPKKIELERQNMETSLMEEIEYNLLKLKNTNQDLYTEYKQKYDDLLTKNINKEVLAFLLGEIEFSLVFKKRDIEDILEFIDNLKREYLDNFLNNPDVKTELNLKKLNKINELFLKVKDKYNYKNQRDVLNNLAFLYLMEVYENRDIITLQELEQSYFCTHLKSIIMWINLLMEENIIECSYIFSLQEDINVKVVFDMINSIKFNNKAKENKILSKIQKV